MATAPVVQIKRPGMIVAMVILNVVNALFALLTAALLMSSGAPEFLVLGIVITTVFILSLIFAVGIWMLRRWARRMMIGLSCLTLPLALFGIWSSGGGDPGTYLTIVVSIFNLYVLSQSPVKRLFT